MSRATLLGQDARVREAEVIQSMAREAGFDIRLQATEFASALQAAQRGEFEAFLVGWSGRSDPDGNIYSFASCTVGQNDGRYCNAEIYLPRERGRIYLWHRKNLSAHPRDCRACVWCPTV